MKCNESVHEYGIALVKACSSGNFGLAEILIRNDADVNVAGKDHGRTALHYIVQEGYIDLVKLLIKRERM